MIDFDFKTYLCSLINQNRKTISKEEMLEKIKSSGMGGWLNTISSDTVFEIKKLSNYIKNHFDCLIVIGIGGSFLGSYSFSKAFSNYFNNDNFEIIYAGYTISSKYLNELIEYIKNKNVCINVISKSGKTMETNLTYKILKEELLKKYKDIENRIIITTDKEEGLLREEVNNYHYQSLEIPKDIGGRYSFLTSAHLLPLSLNYDIDKIIKGYEEGKKYIDEAYEYARVRKTLYDMGKRIENFCVYEENFLPFCDFLKQLFGETEGKEGFGIYPTKTLYTRDLHSLGQFIQEGSKIIFETIIHIKEVNNNLFTNNMNTIINNSVKKAHFSGNISVLSISLNKLTEENFASLIYFFQLSAAFSAYLFNVNPFNQPGVEVYKKEIRKALENETEK